MKSDINTTLNKLVSYAFDNLLLDPLDGTYTLNRLAAVCGATAVTPVDVDYGDATLGDLLAELKAAVPAADIDAVKELLFPLPRTVGYYFNEELNKSADKALAFLFDLYEKGGNISAAPAVGKNGFVCYSTANKSKACPISLDVNEPLGYTPLASGNRVAALENPDILADDIVTREIAYVSAYGGVAATRIGETAEYLCAEKCALATAAVKQQLSNGTVKTAMLDYPVPTLAFNGIAKNAVAREAARVVKAAADAGLSCVTAAAATNGITVYVIFANDIATDDFITGSDALTACGVFKAKDCSPLLSVLEKGTALSNELAAFRPIYDQIGGVKHGAKAGNALGGVLVDMGVKLLGASASATDEQVKQLTENK